MRRAIAALALALPLACGGEWAWGGPRTLALVGVHVIPMDRPGVLRDRTVLVRDGRIVAVAPRRELRVPAGAERVEVRGAYLLPGLVDMHVHLNGRAQLRGYLARGVTTVRNMRGRPDHLRWREEVAHGARLGPRILTAGPVLDGDPPALRDGVAVRDASEAFRAVGEQAGRGYDFVKVYGGLSAEAYVGIAAAARAFGLPVVGHVPEAVGLDGVLAAGQASIEHAEELTRSHEIARDASDAGVWAQRARAGSVWLCPTLALHRLFAPPEAHRRHARLVASLHARGMGLLLGSDARPSLVVDELLALVEAGLSPTDALAAATREAAAFLGLEDELGTVAPGRRADLLLLDGDPREDVGAVARMTGVVVAGRWLPERTLARWR